MQSKTGLSNILNNIDQTNQIKQHIRIVCSVTRFHLCFVLDFTVVLWHCLIRFSENETNFCYSIYPGNFGSSKLFVMLRYWSQLIILVTLEKTYSLRNEFSLNQLLICCLLIFSNVVIKFRYGLWLRGLKYGHAEWVINMCFISTNKQLICILISNLLIVSICPKNKLLALYYFIM